MTLRKNDELVEILFLPWCSLERDCVNGTEIELPKTEEIWLQLFLSDEKLGLRGYASSERLINTNSTLNSCLDSYQGRDLTDQQTENALSLNSTTTPLTRTTMCDFLLEYPLIEHNAGKWQAAKSVEAVPPDPDTLIIYAFSHSDGWREDNLFYLLAIGLPKLAFIGTGAWFFMLVNAFKVPFSAKLGLIHADSLRLDAWLVLPMIPGALLGPILLKRLNQRAFEVMVLSLTTVAAVRLLF